MKRIFLLVFICAGPALATHTCGTGVGGGKCFIDFVGGSDSNTGATNSVPWQHLPGMAGATGNASSQVPIADDVYILKGGVSWTNAAFPITWAWSGTSGHNIIITVDQTYFTGGSWTRPIFNAGGSAMGANNNFIRYSGAGSNVTWDNIEFTGLTQQSTTSSHDVGICLGCAGSISNVTITNCYFHNWSHGTQTADNIFMILGDTNSPYLSGSVIEFNVADNADGDGNSGGLVKAVSGTIKFNAVNKMPEGILMVGTTDVGNNLLGNIVSDFDHPNTHENAIEDILGKSGNSYVHDNVIHDVFGEAMFLGGNTNGEVFYVWNNVLYNLTNANPFHIEDRFTNWNGFYFNNTVVPAAGTVCFLQVGSTATVNITLEDNHCITTGSLDNLAANVTPTRTTNTLMTPTTATTQGYTNAQTFAYSPTAGGNSTVGSGTNNTAGWPGGFTTSDTAYACTEISGSGGKVVSCPARTSNSRPGGSTAWDTGSYMFTSSGPGPSQLSTIMLGF